MDIRPGTDSPQADDLDSLKSTIAELQESVAALSDLIAAERRSLERELDIARRIQLSLMPTVAPVREGWEIAMGYRAARTVGGDFYDVYSLGRPGDAADGRVGFVIADVTGKGITAALMMAFSRAVLRSAAYNATGPADALVRTNRVLAQDIAAGLFLTAVVGELDPSSGRVRYASAGHEAPLLLRAVSATPSGTPNELPAELPEELPVAGVMVGLFETLDVDEETVELATGDLLVCYTDGVTDAQDGEGERFGDERFRAMLGDCRGLSASEVVAAVLASVSHFSGDRPAADDITLLVIRRLPV